MKLTALLLVIAITPAYAEDKVAAETAFRAGKELERAGKLAEACPLYESSYRADPQLGALLNLANCHEVIGRTATAWVELREALELATRRNDARADFARRRIAALEPRLVRLRIDAPAGVIVHRDATDVSVLLAQDLVVDPGTYRVRATAPHHVAWETSVSVSREGDTVRVTVPALAPIAVEPASAPPAEPRAIVPPPPMPIRAAEPKPASSARRTATIVIGATGLAAAAIGLGFGYHAKTRWAESRESTSCDDHNVCNAIGSAQIETARSSAKLATWGVSAGAALIVTAGVVWLTAPSKREQRRVTVVPAIDRREAGIAAIARF